MYPDANCRLCPVDIEDNDHIWNCPRTSAGQQEMWNTAIGLLDTWGPLEATQANNNASRLRTLAAEKGKDLPPPTTPIKWCPIPATQVWESLSFIEGTKARQIGLISTNHVGLDEPVTSRFTVGALYRGLTPLEISQRWKALWAVPLSVSRRLAHRFVTYLAAQATERIWRPRCTLTVAWEQHRGITKARKRVYRPQSNNPWTTSGFLLRNNCCPCGAPLQHHLGGLCPGAQANYVQADRELLQSLLGQRHLHLMARRGKIPFL